ncbi:MAG: DUF4105 domain-containing protein [Oligoflexia bacterium]|nr:DUF4105 domain-containing protein [Oligoflexia bacterium]
MLTWFLLVASTLTFSYEKKDLATIAESKEWTRLLYYKQHFFRGYRSALDGKGFFLAPNGDTDRLAELEASIAAFERGGGEYGRLKQPIHCAFPARKEFLERVLSLKFNTVSRCEHFEDFQKKTQTDGVALVFASAYPNNPASMFGHSFLKFYKKSEDESHPGLLDWSINYAAVVSDDENPFAFAYFGLTGGYQGQFSLLPYYTKVAEYGYFEGRDLWEYELNLNSYELQRLINAVWEVETNSYFNYFFGDENCSFQLLTLLEVAKLDWDISGYFVHMIPGESIKKVAKQEGAVHKIRFRPSLHRRIKSIASGFSKEEDQSFDRLKEEDSLNENVSTKVLQAYNLYLLSVKKQDEKKWTSDQEKRYRQSLIALAAKKDKVIEKDIYDELSQPDKGHGPYGLGLGAFARELNGTRYGSELYIRFAYHELVDGDLGYLPFSHFLFPNFTFRWMKESFYLESAEALSIISLTPWSLVSRPFSWRGLLAYKNIQTEKCGKIRCMGIHASAAGGPSFKVSEKMVSWIFFGAQAEESRQWSRGYRLSNFLDFGFVYGLQPWKLVLESRLHKGWIAPENGEWLDLSLHSSYMVTEMSSLRLRLKGQTNLQKQSSFEREALISTVFSF